MRLKLALVSRFPPIEGGISAKTYWLARGLASRGHEVHVLTHAVSAGMEYEGESEADFGRTEGVVVHRPSTELPWHIPEDREQSLGLLNLAIGVCAEREIRVVDSGYLVPYGIVGQLASTSTGARHVLRHGGSDIEKFLKKSVLGELLRETISRADVIVTEPRHAEMFSSLARGRVVVQPAYVPDASAFTPGEDSGVRGKLGFIGKANYFWQHKRLHEVAAIMHSLSRDFECWFVAQGKGLDQFRKSVDPGLSSRALWRGFAHPCQMPELLRQLDAVFVLEGSLPHQVWSNLALEAMSCGTGVITDRPDFTKTYREVVSVDDDQVLVVRPGDTERAATSIRDWVRIRRRLPPPVQRFTFDDYLSANEEIYRGLLRQ